VWFTEFVLFCCLFLIRKSRGFKKLHSFPINRLISERGLPALRHLFDNVKFKGKGHEVRHGELLGCFLGG